MVEESEPPGQGSRMGESDFLAERRARRATETGEAALLRRAEAAEATVKTLESHVASLQSRLQEIEEERRRAAAMLEAERTHGSERESELRRVKQREYAEQQLRVEAEDRLTGLERTQRRGQPPGATVDTSGLTRRIDALQRQLSEAEQAAGAERASLRRAEDELQARVAELERRAAEIQRGLVAERSARERSERELATIREGHRRMEGLLGEIRALISRLGALLGSVRARPEAPTPAQPPEAQPPQTPRSAETSHAEASAAQQRGLEMADALAAAVQRLRARAQTAPPLPEDPGELEALRSATTAPVPDPVAPIPPPVQSQAPIPPPAEPPEASLTPSAGSQTEPVARPVPDTGVGRAPQPPATPAAPAPDTPAPAAETPAPTAAEAELAPAAAAPAKPVNKHSQSLIGRIRNRRKQRRAR